METIEDRLDSLEAAAIQSGEYRRAIQDLGEAVEVIKGVLEDLIEGRTERPEQFADDLERLDELARFAKFLP